MTRRLSVPARDVSVWSSRIFPVLRASIRTGYFSLEVIGAENVPRAGQVVYVGNHSGWFAVDALVFALAVHDHVHPSRVPFAVVQDILLRAPGLSSFFAPLGVIPSSRMREPEELPDWVDAFGVFPEGVAGICKPVWQAYQMRPWRSGFVRLAASRRASIVPVALIGGEECLPTAGAIEILTPLIGTSLPIPLSMVPLPTRWKMVFGAPITLAETEATPDLAACRELSGRVRAIVQSMLDEHTHGRSIRKLGSLRRSVRQRTSLDT